MRRRKAWNVDVVVSHLVFERRMAKRVRWVLCDMMLLVFLCDGVGGDECLWEVGCHGDVLLSAKM